MNRFFDAEHNFSVDEGHFAELRQPPRLRYREDVDFPAWKEDVRQTLLRLLGHNPARVPLNFQELSREDHPDYTQIFFTVDVEAEVTMPCALLIPKTGKAPYPLMVCLQGHSTGMHISYGKPIFDGDVEDLRDCDRDYAIRCVKEGFAALCVEQRGFGIRKTPFDYGDADTTCYFPSMCALLVGRTMIGERIWDVSRALDAMPLFPEIDCDRIACMGNSGGGTATYYTTCLEPRIKAAMPAGSVCTYRHSIGAMRHCVCNYIPGIAKELDMGELACLIAPRPLVVVSGIDDPIFPKDGVEEVYSIIEKIYQRVGSQDACRHVIGNGGHRFFADLGWKAFHEITGW